MLFLHLKSSSNPMIFKKQRELLFAKFYVFTTFHCYCKIIVTFILIDFINQSEQNKSIFPIIYQILDLIYFPEKVLSVF